MRAAIALLILTLLVLPGCAPESSLAALAASLEPAIYTSAEETTIPTPAVTVPVTATPLPSPERLIYVLDSGFSDDGPGLLSSIMAIDPSEPRVVFTLQTRYLPDAALSPDGRLLYVADTYYSRVTRGDQHDVLSVYDALTGELLVDEIPIPDRLLYKGIPHPGHQHLLLSPDGGRIFVRKYGDPDSRRFRLAALDTTTFQVLYEGPHPPCDRIVQVWTAQWLCADNLSFRMIEPQNGQVEKEFRPGDSLDADADRRQTFFWQIAGWAWSGSVNELLITGFEVGSPYIVERPRPLEVLRLNLTTGSVSLQSTIEVPASGQFRPETMLVAPDDSRLYVGVNRDSRDGTAWIHEIWLYDAATGQRLGIVNLPDPVFHFALSAGGEELYAVSPKGRSLAIFDAQTLRQTAFLTDLGITPSLLLIPGATNELP